MSSYEKISAYLEAHPTPWRIVEPKPASPHLEGLHLYREPDKDGHEGVLFRHGRDAVADVVVDANGQVVFESADNAGEASWIEGDVRALVDFVNLVGNDYEPPCGWPGVDYGPIEPVDQHELYEYGVTYNRRDTGEKSIEWCDLTGDAELDRETIRLRVVNWRKAGQDPKVVRRRVGPVEQEPPEGWFKQKPRLRPVD